MMFYDAVGGEGFAGLPNRYQADCDLSRLLDLDRAILVANGTESRQPMERRRHRRTARNRTRHRPPSSTASSCPLDQLDPNPRPSLP